MKYEYNQIYVSLKDGFNHLEMLNEMGEKGWELVASVKIDENNIMYLFKKQKQILLKD